MTAILHFTRDLRLEDHAALAAAANETRVVPVVILDPATSSRLRSSPRRAAYYCSAIAALDRSITARGGRLIIRRGRTASTLRALARAVGATSIVWSASYDAHGARVDRDVQAALEEAGLRATVVHDAPAVTPEETGLERRGYRSFPAYFERWMQQDIVPYDTVDAQLAAPEVSSEALPIPAEFGRASALDEQVDGDVIRARFERFLESEILHYAVAKNVPADGQTSQLAAPLSFGIVAARSIVAAVRNRRADRLLLTEERISIDLFLRALSQRDFFLQLAYFYEALDDVPLQDKMRRFSFSRTHPALDAWRAGKTGYPLIDAGIRQLRATGWMHPRVRALAASFLCFDLGVDWRVGREEWDHWLVEDEPALATGNWQWIAGVGADLAAYPRIYNPRTQTRRCDPAGRYIRQWLPELASRSDRALFEPGADARSPQLALSLFGTDDYPAPVVEHDTAARAFLERYKREVSVAAED